MLNWLFGRDLNSVLSETKKVRIKGICFKIKKINVLNHLDGSRVMSQIYDVYKVGNDAQTSEVSEKKIREYYSQILFAGVVHPKLKLKEDGDGILVEELFVDWEIVEELFESIMVFTYGKKKIKQLN